MATAAGDARAHLLPTLGLASATLLIVGSSIGSGIFRLPAQMAEQLGSPWLLLGVWVLCGLLSLAGALTFAEMAAMFPRAGGQYVFLREAFGDRVAFLYGWTFFWVIQTGIIAAVATVFAAFLAVFVPMDAFAQRLVAMALIAGLSLVNYVGVKYGGLVSNVFTTLKVGAIAALVLLALVLASPSSSLSQPVLPAGAGVGLVGAIGLAMSSAFFAYDGWNQSAFIASEIKSPQRNVPLSMMLGVLTVMTVYVLANLAYVFVLPFDQVSSTPTLAADVGRALLGPAGATLITIAILVAVFGTVNAYVLSGPRVMYAMAQDGLAYNGMGSLSPRFATPDFSIIVQAEWAMLLVLTGSFEALVNYSVFGIWLFYGIAAIGFFRLRRTHAHLERPYRTVGYPFVPALLVATSLFICVNGVVVDVQEGTVNSLGGLVAILTGVPALALLEWRRRAQKKTVSGAQ